MLPVFVIHVSSQQSVHGRIYAHLKITHHRCRCSNSFLQSYACCLLRYTAISMVACVPVKVFRRLWPPHHHHSKHIPTLMKHSLQHALDALHITDCSCRGWVVSQRRLFFLKHMHTLFVLLNLDARFTNACLRLLQFLPKRLLEAPFS